MAAATLVAAHAYQLLLLAAAAAAALRGRGATAEPPAAAPIHIVVLIPARDEEVVIAGTLAAVARLDHPNEARETIVVADACTDATARVARDAGATVWERDDPARAGKGHALSWALDRVLRERPDAVAVVVVDADCRPSPNLLTAMAARLESGAAAVQAAYVVANPERSAATGLRYAAFALMNHVRPRGRDALGLSCGLLGTGMGFGRPLLERVPWLAHGLAEDAEQHVRLVEAGERVRFAHEAAVESPMPAGAAAGELQQSRWERGRLELARRHAPRLLADGLRERDARRLFAAADLVLPPQSLLSAAGLLTAAAAALLRLRVTLRAALACLAAQAVLVLGGLALVRAPAAAYRALLQAPLLIAAKLRVYAGFARGGAPTEWERTPRESEDGS